MTHPYNNEGDSKTCLIVNYLPQSLKDDEFTELFEAIGPLKNSKVIRDRATSNSYGFGFVDYHDPEHSVKAIQTLSGLQLQNKTIKVAYSRSGENIKGGNLYIRNIPKSLTVSELEQMFAPHGQIVQCRILTDHNTGQPRGIGFVLYNSKDMADSAIQGLNGVVAPGGTIGLDVKHAEDGKTRMQPMPFNPRQPGMPQQMGGGAYPQPGGYNGAAMSQMGAYQGYSPKAGPTRSMGGGPRMRYNPMGNSPMGAPGNDRSMGMAGGFGGGPDAAMGATGYTLFVYNVGLEADEKALYTLFAPFGAIQNATCVYDQSEPDKPKCKGFGFVTMTHYQDAVNAIEALNGYEYTSARPLQVSFKTPK